VCWFGLGKMTAHGAVVHRPEEAAKAAGERLQADMAAVGYAVRQPWGSASAQWTPRSASAQSLG